MRWLAALLALLSVLAAPALAVDVDRVVDQLREDPVLIDAGSAVVPDADRLRQELRDVPVPTYVVVLPQAQVDPEESGIDGVLLRLVEAMDDPRAVVVVVTDAGELQAGEGGASGVDASAALDRIVQERADQEFDETALTEALVEFAEVVRRDGAEGGERGISGSPRRAIGVAGIAGVGLLAAGLLWARAQRKARAQAPLTDLQGDDGTW